MMTGFVGGQHPDGRYLETDSLNLQKRQRLRRIAVGDPFAFARI
jgi:hypothetical protein